MYRGRRIVSVTCARGNSKGVPGKNLRPVAGKALIASTIEAGLASRYLDECVVSTDSVRIARVAEEHGASVPFLRPAHLAQDGTPQLLVLRHAVQWLVRCGTEPLDAVVTLQPTTPMRTPEQIDAAIRLLFDEGADVVLGVTPAEHSPYWMFTIDDGRLRPLIEVHGDITSRHLLPPVYRATGSIYVNRAEHFLGPEPPAPVPLWELGERVLPLVIEDPLCRVDLDTEVDFVVLETLLRAR